LQDHKRAVIMGTQSFGKGSVQTILPLGNNTAVKLTTARYYTPGGRSIQAKGIVPDIVVEDPSTSASDNAFRLREADLDKHLSNDKQAEEKPEAKKASPATESKSDTVKVAPTEFGAKTDYQLNQAINLLKGMQILHGK
jgi:carboxyl-terminal processing protease